jgi:hypothetical protein
VSFIHPANQSKGIRQLLKTRNPVPLTLQAHGCNRITTTLRVVKLSSFGTSRRMSSCRVLLRRFYTVLVPGSLEPDILRSVPAGRFRHTHLIFLRQIGNKTENGRLLKRSLIALYTQMHSFRDDVRTLSLAHSVCWKNGQIV